MKIAIFVRYLIVVLVVTVAWWVSRDVSPRLITLIGLFAIVVSTVWLLISLLRNPEKAESTSKSWWKIVKDAFWGL